VDFWIHYKDKLMLFSDSPHICQRGVVGLLIPYKDKLTTTMMMMMVMMMMMIVRVEQRPGWMEHV